MNVNNDIDIDHDYSSPGIVNGINNAHEAGRYILGEVLESTTSNNNNERFPLDMKIKKNPKRRSKSEKSETMVKTRNKASKQKCVCGQQWCKSFRLQLGSSDGYLSMIRIPGNGRGKTDETQVRNTFRYKRFLHYMQLTGPEFKQLKDPRIAAFHFPPKAFKFGAGLEVRQTLIKFYDPKDIDIESFNKDDILEYKGTKLYAAVPNLTEAQAREMHNQTKTSIVKEKWVETAEDLKKARKLASDYKTRTDELEKALDVSNQEMWRCKNELNLVKQNYESEKSALLKELDIWKRKYKNTHEGRNSNFNSHLDVHTQSSVELELGKRKRSV